MTWQTGREPINLARASIGRYRESREREGPATGGPRMSILLRIAEQVNIAPCLLARHILRIHFVEDHRRTRPRARILHRHGSGSGRDPRRRSVWSPCTVRVLPPRRAAEWPEATVKAEVNGAMKSPHTIADAVLRDEVQQCIDGDDSYSPDVTLAKQLIGHEYELRLRLSLTNAGIPFICTPPLDSSRARWRCRRRGADRRRHVGPSGDRGGGARRQRKPTCASRATPKRPTFGCKCRVVRSSDPVVHRLRWSLTVPPSRCARGPDPCVHSGARPCGAVDRKQGLLRGPDQLRGARERAVLEVPQQVGNALSRPKQQHQTSETDIVPARRVRRSAAPRAGSAPAWSSTGLALSTSWPNRMSPSCCWTTFLPTSSRSSPPSPSTSFRPRRSRDPLAPWWTPGPRQRERTWPGAVVKYVRRRTCCTAPYRPNAGTQPPLPFPPTWPPGTRLLYMHKTMTRSNRRVGGKNGNCRV